MEIFIYRTTSLSRCLRGAPISSKTKLIAEGSNVNVVKKSCKVFNPSHGSSALTLVHSLDYHYELVCLLLCHIIKYLMHLLL